MAILMLPFRLIGWLVGLILSLCGKLLTIILGLAFTVVGLLLCAALITAFIGLPLSILGISMIVKGVIG